jgi:hypothetical protein
MAKKITLPASRHAEKPMKAPLLKVNFRWGRWWKWRLLKIQDVLPGKLSVQVPNVRHNSWKLETKV